MLNAGSILAVCIILKVLIAKVVLIAAAVTYHRYPTITSVSQTFPFLLSHHSLLVYARADAIPVPLGIRAKT